MQNYWKFLLNVPIGGMIIISLLLIIINIYDYVFGGFPFSFLTFSIIIMAVSFFTISIILYKTWSLFPPIIIRSIDTALLLCGMLGVLSLSNIQIIQKKNVLLSADTRFERPSKEFTAFIQPCQRQQ